MIARSEQTVINVSLNKSQFERFKAALTDVVGEERARALYLCEGDTLSVNYSFFIHYVGTICRAFNGLLKIMDDPDVVVSADLKELNHGECLIYEVLKRLEKVRRLIHEREVRKTLDSKRKRRRPRK